MVEITIAEAMVELKLLNKKIENRMKQIKRYSSKAKMVEDEIENQEKYVKELLQSAEDLIQRYTLIKLAIQKSNLETTFEFQSKTYTIAEAILMKQGLLDLHEKLWDSLSASTGKIQINEYLKKFGVVTMSEDALEKIDLVPFLFYDEKLKEKKLEDLLELRSYLDRLIDKSNHQTTINIE
jgi:hypothetical protein